MWTLLRGAVAATALATFATLGTGAAPAASLPGYSGLVVFGDSLVDAGNAELASPGVASPRLGYFDRRFSNGYTFADDLSFAINGTPTTPLSLGGVNFAVGGAQAYGPGDRSPDFAGQLAYLGAGRIPASALVLVTFGGNDVRSIETDTAGTPDFAGATGALRSGLQTLIDHGARNIVVTGLPDIGTLPDTLLTARRTGNPLIPGVATQRSGELNGDFRDVVGEFAGGVADVSFFDLLGYEEALVRDPAAFGLPTPLDATTPCITGQPVAAVPECTGKLYFDTIHPTRQVHQAIADAIVLQLGGVVPEPATWATMVAGFGLVGAALRRRPRPARA